MMNFEALINCNSYTPFQRLRYKIIYEGRKCKMYFCKTKNDRPLFKGL